MKFTNRLKYFEYFRSIFSDHKLNFVKQMLKKNDISDNWVDTLIALSDIVIGELSPDLSTDSENMSICEYVIYLICIIIISGEWIKPKKTYHRFCLCETCLN